MRLERLAVPVLALLHALTASAAEPVPAVPELVIYTYDSFVSHGGLGPEVFPLFEKKCGCKVRAIPSGDGAQLLTRIQLDSERGKPTAQVVLGIDQQLWQRAKPFVEEWGSWKPKGYDSVVEDARVEPGFMPFDLGYFAFIADGEALKENKLALPDGPISLHDLLKPEWKRNLILEDPRTSTPGLALVLFTDAVLGPRAWDFWSSLRPQWLTLAPGWNAAYSLFMRKEAPLVWSYTTSQAYHAEHGDSSGRYRAILFKEGQPLQIEGAALVKGALADEKARARAREFLEFLLSKDVQERVPRKNWMLPVVKGASVPESFKKLPKPVKVVRGATRASDVEQALASWARAIEEGK